MSEKQICRICSSTKIKSYKVGDIVLLHCSDCDLYFNEKPPDLFKLKDYYESEYKLTSEIENYSAEKRRFFRLPEQIQLISIIMGYKKPPATILDFGCDKGFFLDEARRYGYKVFGVESNKSSAEYADEIGLKIYSDIVSIDTKIDIVTMWHSLEHLPDPKSFLKELKSIMSDGAMLFIRVPAFDSFWRRVFSKRWVWFQPENHYFHYTIKSITNLLNSCGFEVIECEHRKPNNCLTKKSGRISNSVFSKYFNVAFTCKKFISIKYQDLTAVEIFTVAIQK